jgi:hypothetical protein
MSVFMRLALAAALAASTLGIGGLASAQGIEPLIVSWVSGGLLLGAPVDSFIAGQDYVVGDQVELYLNGEYHSTVMAELNEEGTGTPSYAVTVVPGDEVKLVRVGDGHTEVMIVADISVTVANAETDVVTGRAPAGAQIVVVALPQDEFGEESVYRFVTADKRGVFVADFSVPGPTPDEASTIDLLEEGLGAALLQHGDLNMTALFWEATSATPEPAAKADCKLGSWQAMTNAYGVSFRNQGDCVSYVSAVGG